MSTIFLVNLSFVKFESKFFRKSFTFNVNSSSSIFDSNHLYQIGNQTKILAWYDNEWGFSKRMIELSLYIKEIAAISLKETA